MNFSFAVREVINITIINILRSTKIFRQNFTLIRCDIINLGSLKRSPNVFKIRCPKYHRKSPRAEQILITFSTHSGRYYVSLFQLAQKENLVSQKLNSGSKWVLKKVVKCYVIEGRYVMLYTCSCSLTSFF